MPVSRVVPSVCAALALGALACAGTPVAGRPGLAGTPAPAARGGRETRVSFQLPNGVNVILEENHLSPVVALQAWLGAGACADPEGKAGLAHLTERVVLAGGRSARMTAWTSFDETAFETVVAAPLALAELDALAATLARASFEPGAIERARADVLGELRRAGASSAAVASGALFGAAFAGHGYGRPVLGTEASLESLAAADVAELHARAYAGGNLTVVAVGDFDAQGLRARATAAFGALPKGRVSCGAPAPALEGPRATLAVSDAGDERLALGFRFAADDPERLAAVDVLAATLAHGGAGRLPRELGQNRQLARAVRATVFHGRDAGLLVVDVSLVAGRAEEAVRATVAEVARAARELGADELESARIAVEADLARGEETAAGHARRLGLFATVAGDADFGERYLARLGALTSARVAELVSPIARPSNVALAAVRPGSVAFSRAPEEVATRLRVAAGEPVTGGPVAAGTITAVGDVVRAVLPSGLRILVLRERSAGAVAAHAVWSGGLRLEDPRTNGATSLLAATLTRGTRTRDAARLGADLAAAGGAVSAYAGRDELGVTATFLGRRWQRGLEILADCLRHPAFADEEVERARRAALERVRGHEDDADVAAARLYAATLWPGHPYRLPLLGTASSLSGLSRRRLADYFQSRYGAANLTIAVVGDVEPGAVIDELRALFADAAGPLVPVAGAAPAPRATDAPTEVFALASKDQAHVVVGYPGLPLRDAERRAADVLVEALGGAEGRLARELGGVSLVGASAWSGIDGGALVFDLASTPDAIDTAVGALRAALRRVVEGAFAPSEVERARAVLLAADARALESRAAVAAALARDEALGLPVGSYRRSAAEIAAVTPETVARVARRLLDPRFEIVAVVRPPALPTVAKIAPAKAAPKTGASPAGARRQEAP